MLSDVDDEVRWTNVETEWYRADTPWMELAKVDADELRRDMEQIIRSMPEDAIRWRFEIDVDGRHIGLVSTYYLDSKYEYIPWEAIDQNKNARGNNAVRALGIEICDMRYWYRGIGTKALSALMDYYRSFGENHFLLETWSGNGRMLGCARKLGVQEVKRVPGSHVVDGHAADDLVLEKVFP